MVQGEPNLACPPWTVSRRRNARERATLHQRLPNYSPLTLAVIALPKFVLPRKNCEKKRAWTRSYIIKGGKEEILPRLCMPGRLPSLTKPSALRCARLMASNTSKKLIQIDVSSDTVCPWCFVGKKNLEKAMEQTKEKFDFEVRWHPFFLNPDAPKEGIKKSDFYKMKFGPVQFERATSRMTEIFRGLGLEYDVTGLTGNTMDSHRLITLAGHQGYDKQNALVDELFLSYFCQGKYIGDKQVLLDAARKVGIVGAEELLEDPNKGVDEVREELNKYSSGISGVPHFVINGKYQLSGGQPSNIFIRVFETAAKDGDER